MSMCRDCAQMRRELELIRLELYLLRKAISRERRFDPKLCLTPAQSRVLSLMLRRPVVANDALAAVTCGHMREGSVDSVKTQMCRLRRVLKQHDIHIKTMRAVGYYLEGEDKKKLARLAVWS